MAGLFITVEGIDGAGKTTHLQVAASISGHGSGRSCSPGNRGGTLVGRGALRGLLLDSEHPIGPETALLMFAARREHLDRVILLAL